MSDPPPATLITGVELSARFFPFLEDEGDIARRGITAHDTLRTHTLAGWAHRDCVGDHYTCQAGRWPPGELEKLRAFRDKLPEPWSWAAIGDDTPWWLGKRTPPVRRIEWQDAMRMKREAQHAQEGRAGGAETAAQAEAKAKGAEGSKRGKETAKKEHDTGRKRKPDADESRRSRRKRRRRSGADEAVAGAATTPAPEPVPAPKSVTKSKAKDSNKSEKLSKVERKAIRKAEKKARKAARRAAKAQAAASPDDGDGDKPEAEVEEGRTLRRSPTPFPSDPPGEDEKDELDASDVDSEDGIVWTPAPVLPPSPVSPSRSGSTPATPLEVKSEPVESTEIEATGRAAQERAHWMGGLPRSRSLSPSPEPDWSHPAAEFRWYAHLPPEYVLPALAYPTKRVEMEITTDRRVYMGRDCPLVLERAARWMGSP